MSDPLIVMTPLILLVLVVWFGFVGCSSFTAADPPAPPAPPPPAPPAPPPPSIKYRDVVTKTAGFAALWPLDETSGNIASVTGPLAPGANGQYNLAGVSLGNEPGPVALTGNVAPLFNGTNGYVDVPFLPLFNPASNLSFSIELWMKLQPGVGGATQVMLASRRGTNNERRGYEIQLLRQDNQPRPIVRARVFAPNVATPAEVDVVLLQGAETAWRHIVVTYAGGASARLTVYVSTIGLANPIRIEKTGVSYAHVDPPGSPLRFGAGIRDTGGPQNLFAGWLDEIAFYNVALSQADVQAHFKAATTPQ